MRSIPQQHVQPAKHPGWPPTASETFGQKEVLKMSKLAGIPVQKLCWELWGVPGCWRVGRGKVTQVTRAECAHAFKGFECVIEEF